MHSCLVYFTNEKILLAHTGIMYHKPPPSVFSIEYVSVQNSVYYSVPEI